MQGVVTASQALAAQRQINFTRSNEYEADRVGIELLSGAGFDPNGMSSFFEKLGRRYGARRSTSPSSCRRIPSRAERVAEARDRARQLPHDDAHDSMAYGSTKARLIALNAADARSGDRSVPRQGRQRRAGGSLWARAGVDADVAARQRRAAVPRSHRGLSERDGVSRRPSRSDGRAARQKPRSSSTRTRSACSRATCR